MNSAETLTLDLMETLVQVQDCDGNASLAAEQLQISQPSISKRITRLASVTESLGQTPWLILHKRRWRLTEQGARVYPVVADLVQRHQRTQRYVTTKTTLRPEVRVGCGQQAAIGFVGDGVSEFMRSHPECRVSLSTPRGRHRIAGVASGVYDFAVVSDTPALIQQHAGMELYVEEFQADEFCLLANPAPDASWAKAWNAIPVRRAVRASEVLKLPFLLPEQDSSLRQRFDDWVHASTGQLLDACLEAGGWQVLSAFARRGIGVAIVPRSAVSSEARCNARRLDPSDFPPESLRLITRKKHGKDLPDVSKHAQDLIDQVRKSSTKHRKGKG